MRPRGQNAPERLTHEACAAERKAIFRSQTVFVNWPPTLTDSYPTRGLLIALAAIVAVLLP